MKEVVLLGATGSIGKQTLDLLRYNNDYKLVAVSFNSNYKLIEEELLYFDSLKTIGVILEEKGKEFSSIHPKYTVITGNDCNEKLLNMFPNAVVINAIMGNDGLTSTLLALKNNQDLLLSNKESLVIGSSLYKKYLKDSKSKVFPIDSEHVALAKLLNHLKENNIDKTSVNQLIVTASGGSLRDYPIEKLNDVKVEDVLHHPTWKMSNKITVDSATLINKAYEVIEASVLFDFDIDKVGAIICKESLVHAEVIYNNNEKIVEFSPCDMKVAIAYALSFGQNKMHNIWEGDLDKFNSLHFENIDDNKYPLFKYTINFYKEYSNYGMIYYNQLDTLLIDAFINKKISFLDIEKGLKKLKDYIKIGKEISLSSLKEIEEDSIKVSNQILDTLII